MTPSRVARPMVRRQLRWVGVHLLGWTLVVIGIAGLILPIIPGIIFLALGLSVLSLELKWAARLKERMKAKIQGSELQSRWMRWTHREKKE